MLADDEAHGAENKETMNGWLASWTADTVAAARHLQPIWSQLSEKVVRFEDSWSAPRSAWRACSPTSASRPRRRSWHDGVQVRPTSSNMAGVTPMNNQVGHVVAESCASRTSPSPSCRR